MSGKRGDAHSSAARSSAVMLHYLRDRRLAVAALAAALPVQWVGDVWNNASVWLPFGSLPFFATSSNPFCLKYSESL